jgi:probable phosphoglycerate mutase
MSNKGKVTVYMMRHGQTIFNRSGRTQGWCDSVLTKEGLEVAVNVGLGLSDVSFKAAYSSDLGRAVKTGRIVIKENRASTGLELNELEGLREVYFGKFEGEIESVKLNKILQHLKVSSLEEAIKKFDFQKEYVNAVAALDDTKEAEDYATALKRIMKCLEDICVENSNDNGGNVLVVSHGGIIRLVIDYLDKSHDIRHMDNACINKIVYENGSFKVEAVNDNSFCEKGKAIRMAMK